MGYAREVKRRLFEVAWSTPIGQLTAIEPRPTEVEAHARALAAAYNDPRNAPLLGHEAALSEADVVEHYETLLGEGAHPFLLLLDGELAGDADLRGIAAGAAEFAFLIAAPSAQGKGLGTRFALMVHGFGFAQLGLRRIYASIVPANVASRRVFEKLGHTVDSSAAARAYADADDDVMTSIDRPTFDRLHAPAMEQIRIHMR